MTEHPLGQQTQTERRLDGPRQERGILVRAGQSAELFDDVPCRIDEDGCVTQSDDGVRLLKLPPGRNEKGLVGIDQPLPAPYRINEQSRIGQTDLICRLITPRWRQPP